ncbi:MAG: replication-associated recombination protein A [Pseudothermotoga sp.]|uniref:replication-associated recombination protein A n=1 Tax=Pseudothermotoga sp. TaxID=2033661 RepID=UPI00076CA581|nr:MAG: AAA ATPase central domain protein [Thermotoga sp. 50_64]MBC7116198.1 replication-associated recombination protein A [Pseudothermotoga sp.]MDK2923917.1 putative ATPase [Pseudothermotoga sp.]HBT38778.1 replication-associated recombination protein A [Pseudothermotoga sp.]HCO98291.1 replication-associated recombination protein A [Pseudothermotoga sp.]
MRPKDLDELVGQEHVLGENGVLRRALESGSIFSCILYGPPGCGKSSIAELIRKYVDAEYHSLSGSLHGAAEIKQVLSRAQELKKYGKRTILFIDEIHRLNKAQQDLLLSRVEDGTIVLIGATTENPSFEIIAPLLSRCRVIQLKPLTPEDLLKIMKRAIETDELFRSGVEIEEEVLSYIARESNGDARYALNTLETIVEATLSKGLKKLRLEDLAKLSPSKILTYTEENHYDLASAFIKSLRGSDPDAALYYMVRMLESGEDPRFIARRMIILASEDIGLADPFALVIAVSAAQAVEHVGMPECALNLAEAAIYLATAPKSNSTYEALSRAKELVEKTKDVEVPLFLRNPVTKLMKNMGYGKGYVYPHDVGGFVRRSYMPEGLEDVRLYVPKDVGKESTIKKKLEQLWGKREGDSGESHP